MHARPIVASLLLAAALALAACGGDDESDGDGNGDAGAAAGQEGPCRDVDSPPAKDVDLEPPPAKPSADRLTAVVETSCGAFEIALDTKDNPKTSASFEYLADNGVFDGTAFTRIVPGFVIQAGDPTGTGFGSSGYSVDEPPPPDTQYTRGVVAMAKTEAEPPGRSGSQFFVVSGADAGLPRPDFAVAGEVSSGLDVVQLIEQFGDPASGGTGAPLDVVVIDSVAIEAG